MFGIFTARKIVKTKQEDRDERIANVGKDYSGTPTAKEWDIVHTTSESLAKQVQQGTLEPVDILKAFSKRAIAAQKDTNCLTEVLIEDAKKIALSVDKSAPLAGVPISIKDTLNIKGYDSSMGYTSRCFQPVTKDSPIVRLLKDAGAVPFVKTNVPTTLLSFESYNDVWGYTDNPRVKGYSAGGSTGGEAALLGYGGSIIGIGSDVAGSVRLPAHFSGCYSIKSSTTRFPKTGNSTTTPGQDFIPAVYSPMARTLADLRYLFKVVIDMKPWNYDYSVSPIPFKSDVKLPSKLKFGVMRTDNVVDPSPACARALDEAVAAVKKQGHEVIEFYPPDPLQALRIASQLLISDAGYTCTKGLRWYDHNDKGVGRMLSAARLPKIFKRIYAWYLEYIKKDHVWATLVRDWNYKSALDMWGLVNEREGYKSAFFDAWKDSGIDFLLTVPNATPAFPHYGLYECISSCGYTFLFNLLDYTCGVLPTTTVDKNLDKLPSTFNIKKLNRVAHGAMRFYNAEKMDGLAVGVQVVGLRLEEEKVLLGMQLLEDALKEVPSAKPFKLLN